MLIIMLFVTFKLAKGSRKTFASLQRQVSIITGYAQEMFAGQKVIKVFNHEDEAIEGMEKFSDDLYKYSLEAMLLLTLTISEKSNFPIYEKSSKIKGIHRLIASIIYSVACAVFLNAWSIYNACTSI